MLFFMFVQSSYRNNLNQIYASSLAFAWLKFQVCNKYRHMRLSIRVKCPIFVLLCLMYKSLKQS